MSTILWILSGVLLGALYLTTHIVLGLTTLGKGHTVLFFVGFVFPLLWIVGAIMGPKRMSAAQARTRLRTASHVSTARPKPPELRAERLGVELRARTAEVAEERRQVAQLRRRLAELDALLESSQPTHRGDLASNA